MTEAKKANLRIALFEPDIPQNTGAILRLAACFSVCVDIIEPCGFIFSERYLKRSGMDYIDKVQVVMHQSWDTFLSKKIGSKTRLILLSTRSTIPYTALSFAPGDTLLLGSESRGVSNQVHETVETKVKIPMSDGARCLNVAQAASIVLSEALRQLDGFSKCG